MTGSERESGGGEAVATSLALYRQSSTADETPEPDENPSARGCPNRNRRAYLNLATGQIVPARCGRNSCPYCLVKNADRRAAAIALAKPERAILLTQVGASWDEIRRNVNRLREYLTREGTPPGEWCYQVEPNPQGTGHHVHAWQHGKYLDQAKLSRASVRAGLGEVCYINRIRSQVGASKYGLKGVKAMGYGLKGAKASGVSADPGFPSQHGHAEGTDYLTLNGRRLTHSSRGFFRSVAGASLGVREAEFQGLRALYGDRDAGKWVPVWDGS